MQNFQSRPCDIFQNGHCPELFEAQTNEEHIACLRCTDLPDQTSMNVSYTMSYDASDFDHAGEAAIQGRTETA